MPQVFHPAFNTISRVSIFGAVFAVAGAILIGGVIVRSPYATEVCVVRVQPVPFSHQHHVGDVGIDCRYCHQTAETSAFAGLPSTDVCLDCHSQLWSESPILAPVRESWRSGTPLRWSRVHDLPDFAYFHHGIHVHKGIDCAVCHGEVDAMPLMYREETLHMEWCLDCHRDPEEFLLAWESTPARGALEPVVGHSEETNRPSEESTGDASLPAESLDMSHLKSKTNCSVCHR
jgi:hypothetical protein